MTGGTGATGATGATGPLHAPRYQYNSSTSVADPGSGKVAFNNANPALATIMSISTTDADGGTGALTLIALLDQYGSGAHRGQILFESAAALTALMECIAASTNHGSTWYEVPIAFDTGSVLAITGTNTWLEFIYPGVPAVTESLHPFLVMGA